MTDLENRVARLERIVEASPFFTIGASDHTASDYFWYAMMLLLGVIAVVCGVCVMAWVLHETLALWGAL